MFYSPSDHPYLLVRKKLTARDLFRKRLEELGLPLVEHRRTDLVFVAELGIRSIRWLSRIATF